MTKKELAQANELENQYWVNRVHFWAEKYRNTTGADHIKALVRDCSNLKFMRHFLSCCNQCFFLF